MKVRKHFWTSRIFLLIFILEPLFCNLRSRRSILSLKHKNEILRRELNNYKSKYQKSNIKLKKLEKFGKNSGNGRRRAQKNKIFRKRRRKRKNILSKLQKMQPEYFKNFQQRAPNKLYQSPPAMKPAYAAQNSQVYPSGYPFMTRLPPPPFISNSMGNPAVMSSGFVPAQSMVSPQNRVVAPNSRMSPILDSMIVQESPKQTFQQNMQDYARRQQQTAFLSSRKTTRF